MKISDRIIRWPTEVEAITISNEFYKCGKIRNVLGCIDGSHIRIKKLKNDDDFINRNIIIQAFFFKVFVITTKSSLTCTVESLDPFMIPGY